MKKEKIYCIYKITSPAKKVYIGQTSDFNKRLSKYTTLGCKTQRKLYHSIIKYGWGSHKIEIIHRLSEYNKDELDRLEIYYGEMYNCMDSKVGLNLKELGSNRGSHSEESKRLIGLAATGKQYLLGTKQSEETKRKRSQSMIGHPFWGRRTFSDETKKKMSEKRKGRKMSEESKEKLSAAKMGKKMSAEAIEKSRLSRVGKKHTEDHKNKISQSNRGKKWSEGRRAKLMPLLTSQERRQKTRDTHLGKIVSDQTKENMSRIILNKENGIFYFGAQNAANSLCLNRATLVSKLNNRITNNTSFVYV